MSRTSEFYQDIEVGADRYEIEQELMNQAAQEAWEQEQMDHAREIGYQTAEEQLAYLDGATNALTGRNNISEYSDPAEQMAYLDGLEQRAAA